MEPLTVGSDLAEVVTKGANPQIGRSEKPRGNHDFRPGKLGKKRRERVQYHLLVGSDSDCHRSQHGDCQPASQDVPGSRTVDVNIADECAEDE